jgi:hypothetical protein
VIVSVHIADVGARAAVGILRTRLERATTPGLRYAELVSTAALGAGVLSRLNPRRVGLIASWDGDDAFERFATGHPLAARLEHGWHARLAPTRVFGAWPEMPGLPAEEQPMDPEEPAAVLTLGRVRLARIVPFVRASAPAERLAIEHPALLAATGFTRPPGLVSTFSLWRTTAEMRAYATGRPDRRHADAVKADRAKPFHHQSAFIRFRPYSSHGTWEGRQPLAA